MCWMIFSRRCVFYEGGALECILNRYKPAWQTFIYVYANSHEEETY